MSLRTLIYPVWSYYDNLIRLDTETTFNQHNSNLTFSVIPQSLIEVLLPEVSRILDNEPTVLHIVGDVVVVAEIHGHILDLFRIINKFGNPEKQKYLFLGDFVDRGDFSTEVAILLFVMKFLWPDNIFILRGNHEFAQECQRGQFASELRSMYGNKGVEASFLHAFAFLPLCAVINGSFFCVHGGIGPNIKDIATMNEIRRPFYEINQSLSNELILSEPSKNIMGFKKSRQKHVYSYGYKAIKDFMDKEGLKLIIRANEGIDNGIEYALNDTVISICSCSTFCGNIRNHELSKSTVLLLKENKTFEPHTFAPIPYFKRSMAVHMSKHVAMLSPGKTIDLSMEIPIYNSPMTPFNKTITRRLPILIPKEKINDHELYLNTNRRHSVNRKTSDSRARQIRKEVLRAEELTGMRKLSSRYSVNKRSRSVWK